MSKESRNKKKQEKAARELAEANRSKPVESRPLTLEERAEIAKNRIANRPIIVLRYRNGQWNKRFIFSMALLVVALIAAIYFLSRWH